MRGFLEAGLLTSQTQESRQHVASVELAEKALCEHGFVHALSLEVDIWWL